MRKIAAYYIFGIVVLIMLIMFVRYLTNGRLVVTTKSAGGTISIYKIERDKDEQPLASSTKNSLSATLHPGKYVVRVSSKAFSAVRVVEVKARKTRTYAINPLQLSDLEPVSSSAAHSIAASASSLFHIDPTSGVLYRIDSQNNIEALDSKHRFNNISWLDTSFGVGRGMDEKLYVIKDSVVEPLDIPFATDDNKAVDFAISGNQQIFISHGPDIYSGSSNGQFTKIYTTKSSSPTLGSWNDRVVVLDAPGDVTGSDIEPTVKILNKSGRTLSQAEIEAKLVTWSRNGKYLATVSEEPEINIMDSSLKTVATVPADTLSSFTWVGDSLYYTIENQLWLYSVPSQTSQLVSSLPAGSVLSDVAPSDDGSFIYLTVATGSSNKQQLYRYSLRGQKAPYYVYQFPYFMPDNSTSCLLHYVNFTYPVIFGESDHDANQVCSAASKDLFSTYAIDTNDLDFKFTQVTTDN